MADQLLDAGPGAGGSASATVGRWTAEIEVQGELARLGKHRLPIPDLIVAASAEVAGLVVLHYDGDFDRIAEVTGQPVEWVVPRGSL